MDLELNLKSPQIPIFNKYRFLYFFLRLNFSIFTLLVFFLIFIRIFIEKSICFHSKYFFYKIVFFFLKLTTKKTKKELKNFVFHKEISKFTIKKIKIKIKIKNKLKKTMKTKEVDVWIFVWCCCRKRLNRRMA